MRREFRSISGASRIDFRFVALSVGLIVSTLVSSCRLGGDANNEAQSGHTHGEYVNRNGDSMGGLLRLPKNGLVVGNVTLSVWGNGVGIGTRVPDPNAQLEVQAAGIAKVLIKGTAGLSSTRAELALDRTVDERGGGVRIIASTDGAAEWWAGVPYSEGSPSDMFQIARHATQPEYDTNTNLTITSTGAVGIRTSTPSGDLHVKGTSSGYLTIGSTGANTFDRGIVFHDNSNTAAGYLVMVPNTIGTDSVMRFYVGGAAAGDLKMVIDDDGKVGIGTSAPGQQLEVNGNVNIQAPGTPTLFIGNSTTAYGYAQYNSANSRLELGVYNDGGPIVMQQFGGNVGIGTASPSEKLHVVGNLRVQGSTDCTLGGGAGATNCTSDIRLKNHVAPIENALDKISRISGVEFDWNEKSLRPGMHSIGVIAQDVQEVFPTAVVTNASGYLAVDYAVLVSPLIQATKELKNRCEASDDLFTRDIARLKDQVTILAADNAALKAKAAEVDALKADNSAMKARLDRIEKLLGDRARQ